MSIEDALKVPLMNKENDYEYDPYWQYPTEYHPSSYKKNPVFKLVLLYNFFVFPWASLVFLGIWNWQQSQETKTRYYIRPDLTYSKSPQSSAYFFPL
jgi:hypothetical protein